MLDTLRADTDILFYNVFGVAHIEHKTIKVSANIVRAGRTQGRVITKELEQPLKNFSAPFIITFGAWVDRGEIHAAYSNLEEHDKETFQSNLTVIQDAIKNTVAMFEGALE